MEELLFLDVEAAVDVSAGEALVVGGADSSLGSWDPKRAVRFGKGEMDGSWSCSVPLPKKGEAGEFKLGRLRGEVCEWEPLADNRRWPSSGLGPKTRLKMSWGEPRIAIEASAAQLEANARANIRKLEDRAGSALELDLERKGDNAYYYAHNRKFEVPADAKVISGPGLITGGAPVLIEAGSQRLDGAAEERTVHVKDYSWADSGAKVKVYVELPEGVLPKEGADSVVETEWGSTKVDLTIKSMPRHKLTIEKLNAEIKVESCTTRVEAHKNRVVLQLAKKKETTWYNLTKSK